jgi:hypothetical protein
LNLARTAYNELVKSKEESPEDPSLSFDLVIQQGAEETILRAAEYSSRLGTTSSSFPAGHAFVNGKHFDFNDVSCSILCIGWR